MDGAGYRMRYGKDEILGYLIERSEHEVIIDRTRSRKSRLSSLRSSRPATRYGLAGTVIRGSFHRGESGQVFIEYALVVALIAVVVAASAIYFSDRINDLFDTAANSPGLSHPYSPPVPPVPVEVQMPTLIRQCLHGRWRNYPSFKSEAECIEYVKQHR
jgi:Flp pilus assembly pilin Flp